MPGRRSEVTITRLSAMPSCSSTLFGRVRRETFAGALFSEIHDLADQLVEIPVAAGRDRAIVDEDHLGAPAESRPRGHVDGCRLQLGEEHVELWRGRQVLPEPRPV